MNLSVRALLLVLTLSCCAGGQAAEVTVFAAASLTDSIREIATAYEKSSGDKVILNLASSNTLAQQIRAGAPADIFLSADEAQMDLLDKEGLIANGTRKDLLGNSLVVITPIKGLKISEAGSLLKVKHLSMGDPQAVPAGIYAKAWLEKAGLWERLSPKVVPAENVRAALAVVASGDAEAGIVYKTDAMISKKVWMQLTVPSADTPRIAYPVALLKDTRHKEAAGKFLSHLTGKLAGETFRKFGFSVIE